MTKKHFILGAATIALIAGAASTGAQAQTSRVYLAGYFGLNTYGDQAFNESTTGRSGNYEMDNALSFAGALGLRLSQQLRIEGELSYRNAELASVDIDNAGRFDTSGEINSTLFFANMYYDFDVPWSIQPFIGGGLGYGWHDVEINDGSGLLTDATSDSSGVVWNIATGVKYRPSPNMAWTAGYRYVDTLSDLKIDTHDINFSTHEFRLGMEWDLPIR